MSVDSVGNVARVIAVLVACAAAAGSATSSSSANQQDPSLGPSEPGPPPPQQMEASRALGLWRSTFGAVKIEADNSQGGIGAGAVQGVWVYQRQGQEVVGYFSGNLRGNVLQFRWQEPNDPPLTGEGYLVFDAQGRQYNGRWWSDRRDRVGDWNGWRASGRQNARTPPPYSGDRAAPDGQYPPPDGQYAPEGPSGEDGQDEGQDPRYAPPPPPPRRDAYRRGQPYPAQQPSNQQQPYPQQQSYPPPPAQQPYR
ncbi:MAG: hypothetical protein H7138_11585 [Myxococcales bacterium]|nr:hypothetical protein [Myxococcales bacterium]